MEEEGAATAQRRNQDRPTVQRRQKKTKKKPRRQKFNLVVGSMGKCRLRMLHPSRLLMEANKDKDSTFDAVDLEVLGLEMHSIRHKPKMCVKVRYPSFPQEPLWVNAMMFKCLGSCPRGSEFSDDDDDEDTDNDEGADVGGGGGS